MGPVRIEVCSWRTVGCDGGEEDLGHPRRGGRDRAAVHSMGEGTRGWNCRGYGNEGSPVLEEDDTGSWLRPRVSSGPTTAQVATDLQTLIICEVEVRNALGTVVSAGDS